jgi:hypothetical protein
MRAALLAAALLLAGCGDWQDVPPAERGVLGSLAAWITGADAARQAKLEAEAVAAEARAAAALLRLSAAEARAARSATALEDAQRTAR